MFNMFNKLLKKCCFNSLKGKNSMIFFLFLWFKNFLVLKCLKFTFLGFLEFQNFVRGGLLDPSFPQVDIP
jgi:hypothetical protein